MDDETHVQPRWGVVPQQILPTNVVNAIDKLSDSQKAAFFDKNYPPAIAAYLKQQLGIKSTKKMSTTTSTGIHKNVKAFLDTIARTEGTWNKGDRGYNVMIGGKLFSSYTDHPKVPLHTKWGWSAAAGRYQFMAKTSKTKWNTWYELVNELNLPDFSPKSQDLAAIQLLKRRKAYNLILAGKIRTALTKTKLNSEWASLPNSPTGQSHLTLSFVLNYYKSMGGELTD